MAVFAAPATAAVASPPAVDQYTQHLPGAGGVSTPPSEGTPVARPELLPSKTQADLSGHNGQLLAQIATARDLGAPALTRSARGAAAGARRGFASVVADTAGTAPSLALIGALVVIAVPGAWIRFTRRRRSSGRPL